MTLILADKDYTFVLNGKRKTRYSAGPYDQASRSPQYAIEVIAPAEISGKVDIRQFLMGPEGGRSWVWEIVNDSTWPVFIAIKKDGELMRGKHDDTQI